MKALHAVQATVAAKGIALRQTAPAETAVKRFRVFSNPAQIVHG